MAGLILATVILVITIFVGYKFLVKFFADETKDQMVARIKGVHSLPEYRTLSLSLTHFLHNKGTSLVHRA